MKRKDGLPKHASTYGCDLPVTAAQARESMHGMPLQFLRDAVQVQSDRAMAMYREAMAGRESILRRVA